MLRLSTFSLLLAIATAQNGYEYNRPGKPFGPGTSSSHLGIVTSSGYSTTTSFGVRPQTGDYGSSTPGYSPGSNYPSGQGYPGSTSQRPGYPGSSYPGQGGQIPSGPLSNYPGSPNQGSSGPSSNFPGQGTFNSDQGSRRPPGSYSGQGSSGGFPGSKYPSQTGFGLGSNGFGSDDTGAYYNGDYSAIPGRPDIDYPILSDIPHTTFSCDSQSYPGYYADIETRCQVFHVCANNKTYDFLCPNGTVFSQEVFVCVWWDQFDCNSAPSLYGLNANLYDYSIVGSSGSFPNSGFNGPQGPVSSYPGGRPQGLFNKYPSNSGSQGLISSYPGSSRPVIPQSGYPGSRRPETSSNYPGSTGSQGPSTGYPSTSRPQGSVNSYPGSTGPYGPSTSYPGSTIPQGPSTSYPGSSLPGAHLGPGSYPGSSGPSTSYPGTTGIRGPLSYSGNSRPSYPGSSPNGPYPGTSNYSGGNQGYPSGTPSGLGFQTGSGGRPRQPNREYLPPIN